VLYFTGRLGAGFIGRTFEPPGIVVAGLDARGVDVTKEGEPVTSEDSTQMSMDQ